jgi:hypothetical protein
MHFTFIFPIFKAQNFMVQSEEDIQLKNELEMLVERLKVCNLRKYNY